MNHNSPAAVMTLRAAALRASLQIAGAICRTVDEPDEPATNWLKVDQSISNQLF